MAQMPSSLEIGGMMDQTDSSPRGLERRELREETGYEGQSGRLIEVFSKSRHHEQHLLYGPFRAKRETT